MLRLLRLSLPFLLLVFIIGCDEEQDDLVDTSQNSIEDIDDKTSFDTAIASGVSTVFFHASWCTTCAAQRPAFEATAERSETSAGRFIEVEFEDNPAIVDAYAVGGFPTIVVFKDGAEVDRFTGAGHAEQELVDAVVAAF